MNQRHSLTLRNDRAEVARMKAWIDDMTGRLGLLPGTSHAFQLCLEEAVTNVVSHAFEPDTVHNVHIALWRDDAVLHAEVEDDGRPLDPLSHALPAPPRTCGRSRSAVRASS